MFRHTPEASPRLFVPIRFIGRSALLVLGIVATLLVGVSTATAGTYRITGCVYNGFQPSAFDDALMSGGSEGGTASFIRDCGGTGYNLTLNGNPRVLAPYGRQSEQMMITFELNPSRLPNTKIVAAAADVTIDGKTGDDTSHGTYSMDARAGRLYEAYIPGGTWAGLPSRRLSAAVTGGSGFVRWVASCFGPCYFNSTPTMTVSNLAIDLEDSRAPNAASPAYSGLLDGSTQRGTRTLAFSASDADSGVQRVELWRKGGAQAIASTTANAGCASWRAEMCPQSLTGQQLSVNTTVLPEGRNELELRTFDASGNVTPTDLPPITVQNVTATPTPAPVATPTPKPAVSLSPAPTLVAGATPSPVPSPTPIATLETPAPTRTPTPSTSATPAPTSAPLTEPVPAATLVPTLVSFSVSAKVVRRGTRVTFSGVVKPAPASSARLVIEAKNGKRWITAAIVRTRDAGAFTWTHRFSRRGTFTMRTRLLPVIEAKIPAATSPQRSFRVR